MKSSPERIAQIQAAWTRKGATVRTVAAQCGCGHDSALKYKPVDIGLMSSENPSIREARAEIVGDWKPAPKRGSIVSFPIDTKPYERTDVIPREDLDDMRAAAQARDEYDEPVDAMWRREEERGDRAIRKAQVASTFRWTAPVGNLLLTFVSDMHIAPGTPVDFKQMRQDAELIRDTPGCYAVLAGDQVDNHIKHASAILSARSQPSDQYRLFEYYLSILGPKCLVVTSGNHDNWTNERAGVDVLGRIVRDHRVFYSPDEAWLNIKVGKVDYVVGVRHQYRFGSQFNQTHTVKQWLRLGPREFDLGVIGHHHEAAIEQCIYRDRFRWVARPGSYQITSGYTRQYGFNHSIPTCPTFLLHGDEKDITGWKSLRAMRRSMDAVNALAGGRRAA